MNCGRAWPSKRVMQVAGDPQPFLGDTSGCFGFPGLFRLHGALGDLRNVSATGPDGVAYIIPFLAAALVLALFLK